MTREELARALWEQVVHAHDVHAADDYTLGLTHGRQDAFLFSYALAAGVSVRAAKDRLEVERRRNT